MFFKELPPLSCLDRDRMMEWETGFGMDRISRTRDETEALRAIKTRRITGETSWHPWECRSRNLPWRECFVNSLAPTRTVGECGSTELALGELGAAEQQWNAVASGSDFLWITHIMVTTLTSILLNGKMSMQLIQLKAQFLLSVFCLCSLISVSLCDPPVSVCQWLAPALRRRRARPDSARPRPLEPTRTRNARNLAQRSMVRGHIWHRGKNC